MHADASGFDNPQSAAEHLATQEPDGIGQSLGDCAVRLSSQPQNHDARRLCRWISLDVGEVQVQRDQRSIFRATDLDHSWIARTAESLVDNGVRFVTGGEKLLRQCRREILVELEPHAVVVTTRSRASSAA